MSKQEQISEELLKVMNEIVSNETDIYKIEASIFIRNNEKLINEKIAYLYNILKVEAKNCQQRQDKFFNETELIINQYKEKLNMVYDEFYCQYVNIQNELQEARNNRRIAMINYQKIINDKNQAINSKSYKEFISKKQDLLYKLKLANSQEEYNDIYKEISRLRSPLEDNKDIKAVIKKKNELYKDIINKCNLKFEENKKKFEDIINKEFQIVSKSLQIVSEQNIFQKLLSKIFNFFNGRKKYMEIINQYGKIVNNINSYKIVELMREDTIEFVADILEIRGIDEDNLENVRIGGEKSE